MVAYTHYFGFSSLRDLDCLDAKYPGRTVYLHALLEVQLV